MAELTPQDLKDIQGLVVSAYAHLPCVSYLLLRVNDAPAARRWLGQLLGEITTSEGKQLISCLNLAVTHDGLKRLGLDAETLKTFPLSFVEGMATPRRSLILGDSGESAPANWDWGGDTESDGTKAVDILLLLFGKNETTLDELVNEHRARFDLGGLKELRALGAGRQPDIHEHFGFADGVGQPAIEGTIQTRDAAPRNVIKAGEILLGYINDFGKPAVSPSVSAALDPQSMLPDMRAVAVAEKGEPRNPGAGRPEMHDLGRNGTYLVFRQLAQHVAKFCHFLDEATRTRTPDRKLDPRASDRLAAKLVGRWQKGAPLVLSPAADDPSLRKADDFGYREDDAHGFNCPIGSHIRRCNPRDSLGPDAATALITANRHRVLRRGRSYGVRPKDRRIDDGIPRGLHFLCLNSDIERQFEFVQQTWINNPVFGGLNGEVDPLIGNISWPGTPLVNPNQRNVGDSDQTDSANGGNSGSGGNSDHVKEQREDNSGNGGLERDAIFTVQADPLRTRVHNLESFVTVKGGAYFFLPGLRALRYLASL